MSLDTTSLLAKLRPPEHRQTEWYCRGIECVDLAYKLEHVFRPFLSDLSHHAGSELLEDAIVALLVGSSQRRLGNGLSP